jgi:Fe-coproporphyrin III synthase
MLEVALLCDAVSDAAREGYNVVSLSGGEPLLYKPLRELLRHAREHGMSTTVTTNGMLLTEGRVHELRNLVDIVAISLDGVPASHNKVRGSVRAFEIMSSRLAALRASGINFGFIFTLTQHNLDELDWVTDFALKQGAKLLQIHPLEDVGNASLELRGATPDATESAYAWFLGQQTQKRVGEALRVQVDLAFSETIKANPAMVYASPGRPDPNKSFAELVSPLVIEADAAVSPIQYAFPRSFSIGNLKDSSLRALLHEWRETHLSAFYALCRNVHTEIATAQRPYFLNWYDRLALHASRHERIAQPAPEVEVA